MAINFSKIFSFLASKDDPEAEKKRLLKQIVKSLNGNRYSKFYRAKLFQADPSLGKFFFELYRIIAPAQVFMQRLTKSALVKEAVIRYFLDEKGRKLEDGLQGEAIEARGKTIPFKELVPSLQGELKLLMESVDDQKARRADACYNLILAFGQFVAFDYHYLLCHFDPRMEERNFSRVPLFEPVDGNRISGELKDFLEAASFLEPEQDWDGVLDVLQNIKGGVDMVGRDRWAKLLHHLGEVKRSKILELMVQHIDKNPLWRGTKRVFAETIVQEWREARSGETLEAIDRMVNARRNAQIQELARQVFESGEYSRLNRYTRLGEEIFIRKNFEGYVYAEELNYLKAFLEDCFRKEIRELIDFLLVRGQWSAIALSQPLSEGFYAAIDLSDKLSGFDKSLEDDGEHGSRLKTYLAKADRDKGGARYIRMILETVNGQAKQLLVHSQETLVLIGKNLKRLQDDYGKNPHELLINWKELDSASPFPLKNWLATGYRKLYYFVLMLQLFNQAAQEKVSWGDNL